MAQWNCNENTQICGSSVFTVQCDCDTKERKLHTIIVDWVMLTKQNKNENKIEYLFSVYIALNSITVATSKFGSVFSVQFSVSSWKAQKSNWKWKSQTMGISAPEKP